MSARLTLASNNSSIFSDSQKNDVIFRSESTANSVLFGIGENISSKIAINSNGVGFGTRTPLNEVDIRGNLRVSENQFIYGNIGIGTTQTNNHELYVLGSAYVTDNIRTSNVFIEGDLTVMGTQSVINTDIKITDQFVVSNAGYDTAVIIQQTGSENAIEVYDNNVLSFVINSNANVGIKTDKPQETFHVFGDTRLSGHARINSNLYVDNNFNVTGSIYSLSNIDTLGSIVCQSNITASKNIYSPYVNNILLNYDVPNVNVTNTQSFSTYVKFDMADIIQDKDSYGNLIPNIDKLYITYSNNIIGSRTSIASNNVQNIKSIELYAGENTSMYSGLNNMIFQTYGLVANSNYNITFYYENSRSKSSVYKTISNISTLQISYPTAVRSLNASIFSNSNIDINFTTPLYTDSYNSNNIPAIKEYLLTYKAIDSIRYKSVSDSNSLYSNSNHFIIENCYQGTIYNLSVYAKNQALDKYGAVSSIFVYSGFNSNNFDAGDNLNNIPLASINSNDYYTSNIYYAIDQGANSITPSFIADSNNFLVNSKNNQITRETLTSNIQLYYDPNPQSSIVGTISTNLAMSNKTSNQILDTTTISIQSFESNNELSVNNNTYLGINLKSINTENSSNVIGNDKRSNYFKKAKLSLSLNYNPSLSNSKIAYSYNKYSMNTIVNLKDYVGWSNNTSNLSFSTSVTSDINKGNVTQNYYFDNIKTIGMPFFSNFGYNITNKNKVYVSGIASGSNYDLDYAIMLENAASYWTVNPMINVQNKSNNPINYFSSNITVNNKYYTPSNSSNVYNASNYIVTRSNITEINKNTLTTGLSNYNYKLLFKEIQNISFNSNLLLQNTDIVFTGYSLVGSNNSNVSIGPFQFDSNSITHSHIALASSSNIYGKRLYADISDILLYPSINIMSDYNNNSNVALSNYSKEAVLYNGYYYGENTTIWKKNWNLIDTSTFNYSSIGSTKNRWTLTKYTKIDGSSSDLSLYIEENSHDDKIIYIKYEIPDIPFESVWFYASTAFNGKNLFYLRSNNDGIKDTTKINTMSTKFIKCPPVEDLTVYIAIGIPITNIDSKYKQIKFI